MTTECRQVLELIEELSSLYPDMRLGQILTWFASIAREAKAESIWDVEDAELIPLMRDHVEKRRAEWKQCTTA
jgi:hypothetical protein